MVYRKKIMRINCFTSGKALPKPNFKKYLQLESVLPSLVRIVEFVHNHEIMSEIKTEGFKWIWIT